MNKLSSVTGNGAGFELSKPAFFYITNFRGDGINEKVEMIIRPEKLEEVKEILNELQIHGMTTTMVSGCGNQKGRKKVYRGTEFSLNLLPKVKVETVVHDEMVTELIEKNIRRN